jgi:3-oxoadipate enol-lactonase
VTALGYHRAGPADAPWLVLGPSLGTTTRLWQPQLDRLAERFQVLCFDLRGHGRSAVPPGPYRLDDLGWDLVALLDRLGVHRLSYAGVSLGGMIGMWLAAAAPERVDRLAVRCSSAYLPPAEGWLERAARARTAGTATLVGFLLTRWFTEEFRLRQPKTVAAVGAMLAGTPDEGYAGCCEAIAAMDLRPTLSGIAARTLVVAGENDPAAPPVHSEEIAAGIRDASLVVLPRAAHLANVERAATVTDLLVAHFGGTND